MNTFLFAVNAVLPIVLLIALGYFLKKIKIANADFFKQSSKLCFMLFLPTTLFLNVYEIEDISSIDFSTPVFAIIALITVFFLGLAAALLLVKDNRERGAVWQCVFRSNYAILGIPLTGMVIGEEGLALASVVTAFIVPLFNILAVISLSVFNSDGKKPEFKKVVFDICKNPLIIGVLLGLAFLGIRFFFVKQSITFRLSDIDFLYKTLKYISAVTTPLALMVLGGQFEFGTLSKSKKAIIAVTLIRLVFIPAIVLVIACALFNFRGASVVVLIATFASPVAVSSAIMAKEMNADAELTGSLVVSTTVVSVITLTAIIYAVKALGMI